MMIRETQRPLPRDQGHHVSPVIDGQRVLDESDVAIEVVTMLKAGNKRVILEGEGCAFVYQAVASTVTVAMPVQLRIKVRVDSYDSDGAPDGVRYEGVTLLMPNVSSASQVADLEDEDGALNDQDPAVFVDRVFEEYDAWGLQPQRGDFISSDDGFEDVDVEWKVES
jgi:hypothetical protein